MCDFLHMHLRSLFYASKVDLTYFVACDILWPFLWICLLKLKHSCSVFCFIMVWDIECKLKVWHKTRCSHFFPAVPAICSSNFTTATFLQWLSEIHGSETNVFFHFFFYTLRSLSFQQKKSGATISNVHSHVWWPVVANHQKRVWAIEIPQEHDVLETGLCVVLLSLC